MYAFLYLMCIYIFYGYLIKLCKEARFKLVTATIPLIN